MADRLYRRTAAGERAYVANESQVSFEERQVLRVLAEETNGSMLGFLLPYSFEKLQALLCELTEKGFVELRQQD